MDRLLSLFSVYDFLGYILAGGLLLAGTYWAFAELPAEPGLAAAVGIIAVSYMAGHLVQSAANMWEDWLWSSHGMPSTIRLSEPESVTKSKHTPYDAALKELIRTRVAEITGSADLSIPDMFAVTRAELRARQLDGRSELMNTMYGLCRGLTTSAGLLIPIFVAAGIHTGDWSRLGIAIGVAVVATVLYARRATRYSFRFADQVWRDFAALTPGRRPGS